MFARLGRRVIGNSAYPTKPLLNPVNDAPALAGCEFQVNLRTDGSLEEMWKGVRAFGQSLCKGDIALFYHFGHAMQIADDNYRSPLTPTRLTRPRFTHSAWKPTWC